MDELQWSLGIMDTPNGEVMILAITTAKTQHQFVIADQRNYPTVARKLHKGIMDLGKGMKTTLITGLATLPDGLKKRE